MKKIRLLFGALLLGALAPTASAQVDNYALRFSDGDGIANLGKIETLASPQSYTLQLWFNPESWTQGASLVRCGTFSIKLGVDHALVVNDGASHLTLTSGEIAAGRWTHLTLRTGADGTVATINNGNKYSVATPIALPADEKSIWLGGDFIGRIDEVRLWNGLLPDDYNSYWQTTLNELNPSWDSLLAYWKLDQEQCANIVDYRAANHGTLSPAGVAKEKVSDNSRFRYLINLAYGNMQRFFDRKIDARHYSLSNRISVIGSWADVANGRASLVNGREDAALAGNAARIDSWQGRNGVIALSGGSDAISLKGALPMAALSAWAVEMWVSLDSWTPGATLFSRGSQLAVTLADFEGTLNVSANGTTHELTGIPTGRWFHFGLTTTDSGLAAEIDGQSSQWSCSPALAATSAAPVAGLGLNAKIDDLLLWKSARTPSQMAADAALLPLPSDEVSVAPAVYQTCTACYNFDNPAEPAYDNMSVQYAFETMRSMTAGMRGVKFTLCVNAERFDACLSDATRRASLAHDIALMGNDPAFDGIDLDFEWTYSAGGWNNIALLCREIRAELNPEKILSVSPHSVAYAYPVDKMDVVDYFNFQIYGPGDKGLFTRERYTSDAAKFINHGYPKEKIVMSYATTTTGGMTEGGSRVANTNPAFYPAGYKGIFDASNPLADKLPSAAGDCFYFLTGFEQTVWRAQYMVDNGLGGIFFWDLGNDLPASHPYSLARGASYAVNSNVEPLITSVPSAAPAPADDADCPIATADPADQGGFDPEEAREAINAALALYSLAPGYHAHGSTQRADLLNAVNQALLGLNDGYSVNAAMQAYLASEPAAAAGPRNGATYNIVGVSSGDDTRRYLHTASAAEPAMLVTSAAPADASANPAYCWTATVNADATFTLRNGLGQYLTASANTSANAADAAAFPLMRGNAIGRLQLSPADGKYYQTAYKTANTLSDGIAIVVGTDANNDAPSTPKRWSGQWLFEEVSEPVLPELYTVAVSGADHSGGIMVSDRDFAAHGDQIYVDPASAAALVAAPASTTSSSFAVDSDARTITVSYGGLSTRKAYRFDVGGAYMAMVPDAGSVKMMATAVADESDPAMIYTFASTADGRFALSAQGLYVGPTPDVNNTQILATTTPSGYYVVEGTGDKDGKFAFDRTFPDGGAWANGSRALICNEGAYLSAWGTGIANAWWTPTEVSEISVELTAIGSRGYAAICLPFEVSLPAGIRAYTAASDGNRLTATLLPNDLIPAATPAIIVDESGSKSTATLAISFNGAAAAPSALAGTFFPSAAPSGAMTLGAAPDGSPLFTPASQPTLPRNSAYVVAPGVDSLPLLFEGDDLTSIRELSPAEPDAPAAVFDLQGRRLAAPARGINIVNGRKLLVR